MDLKLLRITLLIFLLGVVHRSECSSSPDHEDDTSYSYLYALLSSLLTPSATYEHQGYGGSQAQSPSGYGGSGGNYGYSASYGAAPILPQGKPSTSSSSLKPLIDKLRGIFYVDPFAPNSYYNQPHQAPMPYNPQCPYGYTCCGGYKHQDQFGQLQCCAGQQIYNPTRQFCDGVTVVDIYSVQPPPPPKEPAVVVQKVSITCAGIRWDVPFPGYACCGPMVYDDTQSECADGKVVEKTTPKPTPKPTTQAPTLILTCEGHKYEIPAFDFQFYACCAHEPYFWPKENCYDGEINPPRPKTTTTSATPKSVVILIVCNAKKHWVPAKDRELYGCCGKELYNPTRDVCHPPPPEPKNKCGGTTYDEYTQVCCIDQVHPKVSQTTACCGNQPYDTAISTCAI